MRSARTWRRGSARCVSGCATKDINANQAANKEMRPIPMKATKGTKRVKLVLQAEGHESKQIERAVHPGPNNFTVRMTPRGSSKSP